MQDKELPQGNGDDDAPMESVEGDENATTAKEKSATVRQNEKLYAEEGMLNTKMRKADKKRRKKDNQSSTMEHDGNDDYDFKTDYVADSAMETGEEAEAADETSTNRFSLPSGVELDNE